MSTKDHAGSDSLHPPKGSSNSPSTQASAEDDEANSVQSELMMDERPWVVPAKGSTIRGTRGIELRSSDIFSPHQRAELEFYNQDGNRYIHRNIQTNGGAIVWRTDFELQEGRGRINFRTWFANNSSSWFSSGEFNVRSYLPLPSIHFIPNFPDSPIVMSGTGEPEGKIVIVDAGGQQLVAGDVKSNGSWTLQCPVSGTLNTLNFRAYQTLGDLTSSQTELVRTSRAKITLPENNSILLVKDIVFTGIAALGTQIKVVTGSSDHDEWGSQVTVPLTGIWQMPMTKVPRSGPAAVKAQIKYGALPHFYSTVVNFFVLGSPRITAPAVSSIQDRTFTLKGDNGLSGFNSRVEVFLDSEMVGSGAVGAAGIWEVQVTLKPGNHSLAVEQIASGKRTERGAPRAFKIRPARIDDIKVEIIEKSITFSGTGYPGATVVITVPGSPVIHHFKILPNALSPLVGLKTELKWTGDSAEKLGATIEPALDVVRILDDGGVAWTLDFSASEQRGRFDLTVGLPELDFVAVAKPMDLYHNKVRIQTLLESAVDLVVGQEPVWLWARVFSHFTGRPVGQANVKWWDGVDGGIQPTDDEGWSRFPFAPKTAGEHSVSALVDSNFDDYADSSSIQVKALARDPWDGLMVSYEGRPTQAWGEKTYFPRRKGTYTLRVTAAQNSELFNHQLALGMTGTGPAQLGVRFLEPVLGKPIPFGTAGFDYQFTVDSVVDGSFGLCFASNRLANLSPVNAMSLGEGSQVVKIAKRQIVNQTLFWGDEVFEQITVVSSVTDQPMAGMTVTLSSPDLGEVTTESNFYGVASIRFVPVTPGAFELTATVGDALYSESLSLPFFLHEPRQIRSLTSPNPSGKPGDPVSAVVNVVSALTGEPLPDVEVEWEYPDRILAPTRTDIHGDARVQFRLAGKQRGALQASVKGGLAGWQVRSIEFVLVPNAD